MNPLLKVVVVRLMGVVSYSVNKEFCYSVIEYHSCVL